MRFSLGKMALVLAAPLLAAGALWAQDGVQDTRWMEDAARRWKDQPVLRKTLPNGLRVLVVPRGSVPWCGMATVFPGGGASSPAGHSGLAHLAEHLMFEEGGHAGPTSTDVDGESMGLRSNAFTLGDYTVLVEEFSPAVLDGALRIHAARLSRLSFDDTQLSREKRVVADERRFRVDEPALGRAEELLTSQLWGDHPFGWPILGWQAHVDHADRGAVTSWVQRHVRPERGVVVLVGAVEAQRGMAAVEQTLGLWRAPTAAPLPDATRAPPAPVKRAVSIPGSVGAHLWAVEAAPLDGAHEATDRVIAALLGRPLAHLADAAGGDGMAPPLTLHAEYTPQVHHGELAVTVDVPEPLTPSDARNALARLLQGMAARGVPQRELVAARASLVAELERAVSTHPTRAEQLAVDEALLGRWDALAQRLRAISQVDNAAVAVRVRQLLASPRQTALDVVPGEEAP
jgi:zinc protease